MDKPLSQSFLQKSILEQFGEPVYPEYGNWSTSVPKIELPKILAINKSIKRWITLKTDICTNRVVQNVPNGDA